jgi:hypothetical protein
MPFLFSCSFFKFDVQIWQESLKDCRHISINKKGHNPMQRTIEFSRRTIIVNILISCLFCLALTLLSGCGSKGTSSSPSSGGRIDSALVGRWEIEEGQPTDGIIEDMELLKDGTGIVDEMGVTWKIESGRLYLTSPVIAGAFDYKISGGSLTLTGNDGQKTTYKKKK